MLFVGPPSVEPTERARAEVTEHAERIYEDTKRDVDAEVARLDAAKAWAVAEMDRVTAEAIRRLDRGGDPDAVERWTQQELAAVIERASAPGFDPRPAAAPPPIAAEAPSATPPLATPPSAIPASAIPASAIPPEVAPSSAAVTPPAEHGCAVAHRSPGLAIVGAMPWILAVWRRRRPLAIAGSRGRAACRLLGRPRTTG